MSMDREKTPPGHAAPDADRGDGAAQTATLVVVTGTSFVAPFMVSAVNVALPAIQSDFHIDAVLLSWIATSYLLAKGILLLPAGQIAEIWGRRKIFIAGLSVFTITNLAAALVPSAAMLIFLRVLQGLSISMVVTAGVIILTAVFPDSQRGRAIGIYVTGVYLGSSVGPTIGGVMTQHLGWRSIFLTVGLLGLAALWLTVRYLKKEWKPAAGQKPDLPGIAIFILSMLAFTYAVTLLPHSGAYAAGAVGVAALGAFAWVEKKAPFPIFEVKLFRENRRFTFSSLATLISYAATYAITFMMSLYLQLVKGFTPQTAGLILIFQPLVQALFSPLSGRLSDRVDPGHIATIGMAVTTAGLLVLVFFSPATPVYLIIAALVLLGAGFGLFSSPNMNAILGSVEKRHVSIASGVVATMRLFGQMVSMVLVTIIFTFLLGQAPINSANQLIFMKSFKIVFAVAAFYSTAAILFSKAR